MTDLRLVLPAAAAWLGGAVGGWLLLGVGSAVERHHLAGVVVAVSVTATAGALVAVLLVVRSGRRHVLLAGIGLGALGLGTLAVGLNALTWTSEPLAGWVDARAVAVIRAQVAGEPRVRTSAGLGGRATTWIEVRLVTSGLSARGGSVAMTVPVVARLPSGVATPLPGAAVEVTGRLGPARIRDAAAAAIDISRGLGGVLVLDSPGPVDRLAHAMRAGLDVALAGVPDDAASLVEGLAVGDEAHQPADLATAMRASGLSHLTAVSGGNVAIVLGVVLATAAMLRLRLVLRVGVAVVALAYFVLLVGPQPSVLRAAVMGAVAVLAVLTGGRRAGPSVLAVGVLLLVAAAPWLALSWGFALSVCATAGLVLLAPVLRHALAGRSWSRRWPPAVGEAVSLTLAAQLATLPVLVAMGGATGWVAVPANLLAMPAVAPVTVLGLAAAGIAAIAPAAAAVLAHLAALPAAWIALVARTCAQWPMARLPWPEGWRGLGVLAGVVVAVVLVRIGWRRLGLDRTSRVTRAMVAVGAAVIVASGVAMPPGRHGWPPPGWVMIMCDVGQGDALIVRAADTAAVVVDAGPEPASVDRCLSDAGVDVVPAVVLTHFHADHVGGLSGVLAGRSVGTVLMNPVREPPEEVEQVEATLAAHGLTGTTVTGGDARRVGEATFRVLWPRRRIAAGSVPNNASIVLVATIRGRTLLLAGDIEPEAQTAIAADLAADRFDVVKVPHHGSKYQAPMLTTWAPAPVALVSVGEGNDYGHPAPETLAAWSALGAIVARTDRDGDVAVVTTGSGVGVVARNGMLPPP